jgi:galactoside 2-L-fucosyltransferase 1/2
MQYYRKRYAKLHFLVASDHIHWCHRHFRDTPNVTMMMIGTAYEDMAVLASCDHTIMSVGTYSWWGAMPAQGTVLYYKDTQPRKNFYQQDFFPPHWIPMSG